MKTLGYYNGTIGEIAELTVPMNDRASFFGDGVYDATYAHNHVIYCLDAHVDRFFRSMSLVRMTPPWTKEELKDLLRGLVRKVDSGDQFVYWQVTRGTAPRKHAFPAGPVNLWVTLTPQTVENTYRKLKLITVEDTRFLHCNIKTLNLLPNVMAAQKAREAGCSEAVFVRDGYVTEGSHSNISIIKDGVFITHPLDNLILPGTERKHMLAYCKELGIPTKERAFTLEELAEADEIIVSSTSHPSMRAMEMDKKAVGMKNPELVEKLRKKYMDEIEAL